MAAKAASKKTTVKPKAPPKPKFGEVGYIFNIQAKIVEVHPEDDDCYHPYSIEMNIGDYDNIDFYSGGRVTFDYESKQDLLNVVSKTVPALSKAMKLDELNKAKAEVVRLTKELEAIK